MTGTGNSKSIRDLFSIPSGIHYFNSAYMSPLTAAVEAAGMAGIRRKARPWQIQSDDFFNDVDAVRALFARLTGAEDPERIAIIPSLSYGVAQVARNTQVDATRNIVIAGGQFPSNVYPWRRLSAVSGAELRQVERPPGGSREWNDRIVDAIDAATALVALPGLHWTDGSLLALDEIGLRAHDAGAAFVIDGTQSIGAMPFNITELRPDAVICAAYKWLTGPYSIGAAYFGPRYDDGIPIEDAWLNREGSEDFSGLTEYTDRLRAGARRYDVGEASNFTLMPMFRAALEQVIDWTPERVQRHAIDLSKNLSERLGRYGVCVPPPEERAAHLFGIGLPPGSDLRTVAAALTEKNVHVSVRGSSVRVSIHLYNDVGDIEALAAALAGVVHGNG